MNTELPAELRIMRHIIIDSYAFRREDDKEEIPDLESKEQIESVWGRLFEEYRLYDPMEEFRTSGEETGISNPDNWSRHYESEEVGRQLCDGTWVGWTYWHGGGKHGEPSAIDWMNKAYNLSVIEEEKLVVVRTFTKGSP